MTNISYTIIIGDSQENCANYMMLCPHEILGMPIFISDMTDIKGVDQTRYEYKIIKTPEYWLRKDVDKAEQYLMLAKAEAYKGNLTFITINNFILPCLSYDVTLQTMREDWPTEVDKNMPVKIVIDTVYGQRYIIYSGNVSILSFCGNNLALQIAEPYVYTGGFA